MAEASGIKTAKVIDVHAHAVLEETMGAAGALGPELTAEPDGTPIYRVGTYVLRGVRYKGSPFMDPEVRIQRMDQEHIDFQMLSPNPLTLMHFIPEKEAIDFCRSHNDALAKVVKKYPQRLAGFAALPIQAPKAAAEELRRAVKELGLWGGYIGTDSPRPLDSPDFDPLYQTFVDLDVPLFIHPGPAGIDGPAGDPALIRYDLNVIAGFAAQETLAVATLIFGGVLHRHPKLDICISHGGGTTAFMYGRMKQAVRKRPWAPDWLKKDGAFDEQLHRLWFDTHVNGDAPYEMLKSIVNPKHLVYGTNFAGWDAPDEPGHGPQSPDLADNARRLLRQA